MTEARDVDQVPAVHVEGGKASAAPVSVRSRITAASSRLSRVAIGATPFLAAAIAWYVMASRQVVDTTFLPSMSSVGRALVNVLINDFYIRDVWVSVYRVIAAFLLSAVIAVPIGLLAGYHRKTANVVEPFVGFVRYMPVPAFVPLCILWFGIGDLAKIAVIWLGTFFQLILLSADVARSVPRDYFEAALTLGAAPRHLFLRILWPASLPGIVNASRTAVGWAWTYLVVAEIAGATTGIGFRIMEAQRYVETPKVFAGIVVIGVLGMMTDLLFHAVQKVCFRWA